MSASTTALAARGRKGLSLWVLAENNEARGFYERLRGRVTGERSDRVAGVVLTEVAYGWTDLRLLTS